MQVQPGYTNRYDTTGFQQSAQNDILIARRIYGMRGITLLWMQAFLEHRTIGNKPTTACLLKSSS